MKTPIIIIYVIFGYALIWHKAKIIDNNFSNRISIV